MARKAKPKLIRRVTRRSGKIKDKKKDIKRKAMGPGVRRSKTGKTYMETRKNRSDKKKGY